jgi:hypothetical protein
MSERVRRLFPFCAVVVALVAGGVAWSYRAEVHRLRAEMAVMAEEAGAVAPVRVEAVDAVVVVPEAVLADAGAEVVVPRVAELESVVAEREAEIARLRGALAAASASAVVVAPTTPGVSLTNAPRRSWMEDLQQNDPERYQEIMERRETARQAARYAIAKKAAHFLQRDTEAMDEAETEGYVRMMDLLADSLALTEQLDAGLDGEARREISQSLRENMRDLSPLLEAERAREFQQIGRDLGYDEGESEAFAAYLTDVVDLTSVGSIFRGFMRGGGGPGGFGGPGGAGGGGGSPSPGR